MQVYYFTRTHRSEKIAQELADRYGTVSYTHLDVYKRQDKCIGIGINDFPTDDAGFPAG